MNIKKLAAPSIVLEWETVNEGGIERAVLGLREIARQIAELQLQLKAPAEVIVCYEERDISDKELQSVFDRAAGAGGWLCQLTFIPVPAGTHYYEKKNIGARLSRNEIVLFFDTDLLPDPGWLEGMLTPFQEWKVSVLVGATHLDHARIYDMAVALFWIFKPAMSASPLHSTSRFVSNNVAMRRSLFRRFPFPDRQTYRGQCSELGVQLLGAGVTMYEQTGASASHPPPPLEKFMMRAWMAGQDEHFYHALAGKTSIATDWAQIRDDCGNVAKRIKDRSIVLRPNAAARSCAWILGLSYYAIKSISYFVAFLQRRDVPAPI
jgi:hypothetical protein